jgi:hypothetical protein
MKKLFILLVFCSFQIAASAQQATDFTANTCAGTPFNLFSELNSGKVIVLCWVMPCGACTGPALTTNNVVQSYSGSNPNTIYMYIVDDYANTTCTSLDTWKNSNGLSAAASFSNAAINMNDYGSTGMPKIVVIGGGNHTVFYNADDAVNATDLQTAINAALSVAGLEEQNQLATSLSVSPNPASGKAEIKFGLAEPAGVSVVLFDLQGKVVRNIFSGKLSKGENLVGFDTSALPAATYLVKVSSGSKNNYVNLLVAR